MSSLALAVWICGAVAAACWLASVLTREYSWTDRAWSLAPVGYAWVFATRADDLADDARATLVAVLITLWGARLTFNFARKGGYWRGGEDYRWAVLRRLLPGWRFAAFNLVFIAADQTALLLLLTRPVWTVARTPGPVTAADVVLAVVFVGLLVGETVADQQRWNFHRRPPDGDGRNDGVLRTGLNRYSRHPNYFFEVAQWWVVVGFAAVAAGTRALPTAAGAVLLTLLFVGSTLFTEWISLKRHPAYADYRRSTSMLVPWRPRR